MSYSLDPIEDGCYPGTAILINKLGITDEAILDEVEATIVSAKSAQWENNPHNWSFDFMHYKGIHQYLFEDLYDWAGQPRGVNISKKGTLFCSFEGIEVQAELIFSRLHAQELLINISRNDFIKELVDFYCITNYLHPFRD